MTEAWDAIIERIIEREGGKGVTAGDPGGYTAFGISQAAHPDVDVKALTKEGAKKIYWDEYITPANLHLLNDLKLAERLADAGVVIGVGAMCYLVKVALTLLKKTPDMSKRLLTPSDINIINYELSGWRRTAFVKLFNSMQALVFWCGWVNTRRIIVEALSNPHRRPFLVGWMRARIWEV